MVPNRVYDRFVLAVIGGFTFCAGFWAVMWHWPWQNFGGESGSVWFWLFMNACNLGLLFLGIPTVILLFADTFTAKEQRSWKPLAKYIPAFLFSLSSPWMFHPMIWAITFVGAS